nr:MAG TPA: Rrf2 family protein [Bacteriophage sp.]
MLTARQMLNKDYDEATRQRLIKAARLLQTGTPGKGIQKEEIAEAIGVSGEREARAYVSALKKKLPVISHNGYKGFRIARTAADVADNERTFLEVLSRVEEMLYGILPNLAFEQKNGVSYAPLEKSINAFLRALEEPKTAQLKIN